MHLHLSLASCVILEERASAQMLFFFLTIVFFLLAAGETHPIVHKVGSCLL